ncbi:major facilitator superfamily domain-containing protein [Xylogone sp. PMI_703]|nr:major facilitator superfamily domain-containing protein [Xylogone sp. PMI_703]
MMKTDQPLDQASLELGSLQDEIVAIPRESGSESQVVSPRQHALIVTASFLLIFTACGLVFSFGVYQELYQKMASSPDTPFTGASSAKIGLIGTLSVSLMTMGGPLVVGWTKLYSPRSVVCLSGLVFGAANIFASFSHRLWQFLLSQGVLVGVGACMAYIPAVTVVPTWFNKRRGLAMGIVISGSGVGGVCWAPALRAMNDKIGFRDTLRLTGSLSFLLIVGAALVLKWEPSFEERLCTETRTTNRARSLLKFPLVDWHVAKSRKFVAQALGAMLQAAAYSTPLIFLSTFARSLGYSESTGASFIAIGNAANVIGKIIIGHVADRMGRLNTLFVTTLISAVAVIGFWLPASLNDNRESSRGLYITFIILYGAFASAYISLFPTCLIELFGVQHFSSVNGVLYMIRGMATLVGTPVTGLLIPTAGALTSPKSYERATILIGALLSSATVAVFWVKMEDTLTSKARKR